MIRRTAPFLACLVLLTGCAGTDDVQAPPAAVPSPAGSAVPTLSPTPAAPSPTPAAPSPTADARQVITLTYAGGKAGGDTGRVKVALGTTVLLRITSDIADEVHVHGVDEYIDLAPGQQAEREFVAETPGVFEVELHDTGTLLTRLQVQ